MFPGHVGSPVLGAKGTGPGAGACEACLQANALRERVLPVSFRTSRTRRGFRAMLRMVSAAKSCVLDGESYNT